MSKSAVRFKPHTGDFEVSFPEIPGCTFTVPSLEDSTEVECHGKFKGPGILLKGVKGVALEEARREARRLLMELQHA